MRLIHYQLFCGEQFFLNRLAYYSKMMVTSLLMGLTLENVDNGGGLLVDFVSCHEMTNESTDPHCLWGVDGFCLVCDSQSVLESNVCKLCFSLTNNKIDSMDAYLETCEKLPQTQFSVSDTLSLVGTSSISSEVYFVDSADKMQKNAFSKLVLDESEFIDQRLSAPLSSDLSKMSYEVKNYKLDFADSAFTSKDFPLPITVSLVVFFRDENGQIQLESKRLVPTGNSFPYVKFTTGKSANRQKWPFRVK